jgi:hypothetical protein
VRHERADQEGDGEGGHHYSTCRYQGHVEAEVGRVYWKSLFMVVYDIDGIVDTYFE